MSTTTRMTTPTPITGEHSPSPQEPRGIYGFVMFIFFVLCIIFYFAWILIPRSWTESWPYEPPQKYWAAAIPILFCTTLFMFAFCIYPAMHSLHDGDLDSMNSLVDEFSTGMKKPKAKQGRSQKDEAEEDFEFADVLDKSIPPASDLDLSEVCKLLYGRTKDSKK